MANTIIKDPVLLPYYISKDQYCYTVIEIITPDEKNLGRFGNKGNQNEETCTHISSVTEQSICDCRRATKRNQTNLC